MKRTKTFGMLVGLLIASLALAACGDVDNNSTKVSTDVRPAAAIATAQQNNNSGSGIPTDPTRGLTQAAGATATPLPPTPTPQPGQTTQAASGQPASGSGSNPSNQPAGGAATAGGSGGGASGGDAAAGQKAFQAGGCAGCHAQGGRAAGVGPKLAGTKRDDAYITNIIRNGKGQMPAHTAEELSDKQITDITAYIRSLK